MSENNNRRKRNWWKRNRWTVLFSVLSAIGSAIIGYLIGFSLDGFTQISPSIHHIDSTVCV